ncbi:CHAT domain-containing protein [Micromonospora sp. NBC_00821]|uniref:CHAT domain-containing protein n=1 Tax=Micromonospora sp. NBC_00821 TaxID=2975977 RepID=UPI002ED66954|nr:CHAT domain-containing protein [Micromonospora sp. NBC_00821]
MVSFFMSYRSDDDHPVARLLDDVLTTRFGSDSVVRDDPRVILPFAELGRRLSASAALIVVIETPSPGESAGRVERLPGFSRRTIAAAFRQQVPVIPVLVDDAELPSAGPLPEARRPLGQQHYRRIHTSSVQADIDHLVDDLATAFGREAAPAGPAIPLILSVEPVRGFMPPPSHGPSAAIVYSTRTGDLEAADSDRLRWWHPGFVAHYSTRYEVDTSDHSIVVNLRLPAGTAAYHFEASITVGLRVTDPALIVRHAITDAGVLVREFLLDTCRPISAQYAIDEIFAAQTALDRRLTDDASTLGGITLHLSSTRLSLDDRTSRYVRERTSKRQTDAMRERAEHPLERWEARRLSLWANVQADRAVNVEIGATPTFTGPPTLPHTAGSGAPWQSVGSEPGARPPSSETIPKAERLLVARAPTQVPAGQDLSVEVRLVTEGRSVPADAVAARMRSFLVAEAGTPVTVTVHAPAGLHAEGPLQQTVLVTPDDDPDPIRFGFGARTPGLHRVDVTAWAGGTFLTEVSVEVSVADGGPFRDGQPKVAPLGAPRARPGEVTMEVRFDGSRYTFQLRSDAALFAPVVESVTNTPNAAVENAIREMQQLAGGGSRYTAAMTREVIRSAGIQLWSELVPADVQDQFWQVGGDMSAFTIATDHDVVPWELLYPLSAQRDAGFLVEQVPVVRRTYGQHRNAKVGLRNPRFVVPAKAPTGAHEEVTAIRAILGAAHSEPITRADELLTLINSGALGATHFACHNTFSADGSYIDMDGGRFKPTLLAEASIRKLLAETGPLVFINACRSAGVAPTYTKMLGWAQQFMSSGAGAFVGTLWAVRSDSSARFATAFYRSLADGATLGAAALAARIEQQDDPLDPTWLAYTVYGDPFATAAV